MTSPQSPISTLTEEEWNEFLITGECQNKEVLANMLKTPLKKDLSKVKYVMRMPER